MKVLSGSLPLVHISVLLLVLCNCTTLGNISGGMEYEVRFSVGIDICIYMKSVVYTINIIIILYFS